MADGRFPTASKASFDNIVVEVYQIPFHRRRGKGIQELGSLIHINLGFRSNPFNNPVIPHQIDQFPIVFFVSPLIPEQILKFFDFGLFNTGQGVD